MLQNSGFETQASGIQPGLAANWSVSSVATGEEFAEFTNAIEGLSLLTSGHETFEGEWPSGYSEGLIQAYSGYYEDLTPAGFAWIGTPVAHDEEDFEGIWGTGRGLYEYEEVPSIPGSFDDLEPSLGEYVEDWEEGWPDGAVYYFDLSVAGTSPALFGGATAYDGFESGWYSGLNVSLSPGELDAAAFGAGWGYNQDFEDFESTAFDQVISEADPSTNTIYAVNHYLSNSFTITFRTDGRMPTGLFPGYSYYVRNKTTHTFQVSSQPSSSIIDFSDAGYDTIWIVWEKAWYWTGEELEV